jgi:hypothetical protein
MVEPYLLGGAAAATFIGFAWLALAMPTHWEQVHPKRHARPSSRGLRCAGSAALAVSLGLCLAADHPSMAALVWLMLLAGSAATVAMTLSARPHWLRRFWPAKAAA